MGAMLDRLNQLEEHKQKNKFVCHKCFLDYAIVSFIKKHGKKMPCDYCDSKAFTIDFFSLIELITASIDKYYAKNVWLFCSVNWLTGHTTISALVFLLLFN